MYQIDRALSSLYQKETETRALDDEQFHQIASQIHTLDPGGNGAEVLVILLLLGIGVFVILELAGVIDVFK
jgi:hypothetical protein